MKVYIKNHNERSPVAFINTEEMILIIIDVSKVAKTNVPGHKPISSYNLIIKMR